MWIASRHQRRPPDVGNLNDAGQMYGRHHESAGGDASARADGGESAFREGMREYLRRFAYGNATWPELVRILDARTPRDLATWSRAWVDRRGRPEFVTAVRLDASGRVSDLTLTQRDPLARGLVWPQRLQVTLGYSSSTKDLTVDGATRRTALKEAVGLEARRYILPNGGGLGYGYFQLDTAAAVPGEHIEDVADPLTPAARGSRCGKHSGAPRAAGRAVCRGRSRTGSETDEQNAQRVLTYAVRTYWRYLTPPQGAARIAGFESALRGGWLARPRKARRLRGSTPSATSSLRDGTAWLERGAPSGAGPA